MRSFDAQKLTPTNEFPGQWKSDWNSIGSTVEVSKKELLSDLKAGATQVWRLRADGPIIRWLSFISVDELNMLFRFRNENDLRRGIASKGALRFLISIYLQQPHANICFTRDSNGKPKLDSHHPTFPLRFNVSHSGDWILIAFATEHDVGIDIERWHNIDIDATAESILTTSELREWADVPKAHRERAFFNIWTLKESYLKGLGVGLLKHPNSVSVSLDDSGGPQVIWCSDNPNASNEWRLSRIVVAQGYSAAVAANSALSYIRHFSLE